MSAGQYGGGQNLLNLVTMLMQQQSQRSLTPTRGTGQFGYSGPNMDSPWYNPSANQFNYTGPNMDSPWYKPPVPSQPMPGLIPPQAGPAFTPPGMGPNFGGANPGAGGVGSYNPNPMPYGQGVSPVGGGLQGLGRSMQLNPGTHMGRSNAPRTGPASPFTSWANGVLQQLNSQPRQPVRPPASGFFR